MAPKRIYKRPAEQPPAEPIIDEPAIDDEPAVVLPDNLQNMAALFVQHQAAARAETRAMLQQLQDHATARDKTNKEERRADLKQVNDAMVRNEREAHVAALIIDPAIRAGRLVAVGCGSDASECGLCYLGYKTLGIVGVAHFISRFRSWCERQQRLGCGTHLLSSVANVWRDFFNSFYYY